MIDRKPETEKSISIARKCELLNLSRSSHYYEPIDRYEKYSEIILEIDKVHMDFPCFGQRGICDTLQSSDIFIGRDLARTLMRHMGICAIYQEPKTTVAGKGKQHKIYPYLLKNLNIERANQVWTTDITYIPMGKGFLYLTAIMDWHTRKILSWRLSNSMKVDFCLECLSEAVDIYGPPEILNTDQGAQYTCKEYRDLVEASGARLSMDGKGRWADNIMIERFWRSIKYEEVYIRAYEGGKAAFKSISNYICLYNSKRPHTVLKRGGLARTPDDAYFEELPFLENRKKGA